MNTRRHPMRKVVEDIADAAGRRAEYERAMISGDSWHISIDNDPYMRLVIEVIGPMTVSVAHYGEKNGDAMRDPEMTFEQQPGGRWIACSFLNDYIGSNRSMVRRDESGRITHYTPDNFPSIWARNIRYQGFVQAARAIQPLAHS